MKLYKSNLGITLVKAIIYTIYGSLNVLQRKKTTRATARGNEVFIKFYAAPANATDWRLLGCAPPDYRKGVVNSIPKPTALGRFHLFNIGYLT